MMATMIVRLRADAAPELIDLERLDRLHAECPGALADARLATWCRAADDGEHVWLDVDACRQFGIAAHGGSWADGFDAMIASASSKGWTDEAGAHVRAHVEHTGS
jgi:hypothetical protein